MPHSTFVSSLERDSGTGFWGTAFVLFIGIVWTEGFLQWGVSFHHYWGKHTNDGVGDQGMGSSVRLMVVSAWSIGSMEFGMMQLNQYVAGSWSDSRVCVLRARVMPVNMLGLGCPAA